MDKIVNYGLITLILFILIFFFKATLMRTYKTIANLINRLFPSLNFVYV